MCQKISILLVDDHALLRNTLRDRLGREPDLEVVGLASNAQEAVQLVIKSRPDIVVMDIDMPGRLCFDAAKDIKARSPETKLIYLSAFFSDQYIEDALAAHALSYLTKDEPPEALVEAIRQAKASVAYFSPKVQSRLVIHSNGAVTFAGSANTRISSLTQREIEILRYLARGMSKKQIAKTLSRSYSTVDKHTENLMAKLDIHDRVDLARFAIREGLAEA